MARPGPILRMCHLTGYSTPFCRLLVPHIHRTKQDGSVCAFFTLSSFPDPSHESALQGRTETSNQFQISPVPSHTKSGRPGIATYPGRSAQKHYPHILGPRGGARGQIGRGMVLPVTGTPPRGMEVPKGFYQSSQPAAVIHARRAAGPRDSSGLGLHARTRNKDAGPRHPGDLDGWRNIAIILMPLSISCTRFMASQSPPLLQTVWGPISQVRLMSPAQSTNPARFGTAVKQHAVSVAAATTAGERQIRQVCRMQKRQGERK